MWDSSNSDAQQDDLLWRVDEQVERSPWGGKMIKNLLLIVTVLYPQWLDWKKKPVMYIRVFVEIYNWCYRRLVYKTYGMVELEKYPISRAENPLNLGSQQFYKISKVLQLAYVVPRDTVGNTFYLNNYIDWEQFNQLYNPE